jgi:hypothetical protein
MKLTLFAGVVNLLAASVLHQERVFINGWAKLHSTVTDNHPIVFSVALREQNAEELKRIALDVSDPKSSKYGQYLTQVGCCERHLRISHDRSDENILAAYVRRENWKVSCPLGNKTRTL